MKREGGVYLKGVVLGLIVGMILAVSLWLIVSGPGV